jgi:prepilin-type N-terminal cleavage/methylation domain-containing protein
MKRGFTLLEILVALAVLAIFTTALLAFTQGTLTANRVARKQAQLLEELKDAAGYLADTLQGAQRVLSSATVNGSGCQPPTCLAVLLPGVAPAPSGPTGWRLGQMWGTTTKAQTPGPTPTPACSANTG